MAVCDDRQLSEAQRVAGYQNQRTGVQQAVRPFSGRPTIENLIDYINRELQPAVKRTRDKVNDVYLQVADNAPSGNPLGFYFSTETAAADPSVGRIGLNTATQDTATILRVSERNGRLVDVAPWLDVMAGGATTPLGVITLTDAINPARFIRFDLGTMTDAGGYWNLGVTPIESSHDSPFVHGGAVVISFIPGVGGVTPATVPAGSLSPIAANTVIGNPTGVTAPPQAAKVINAQLANVLPGTVKGLQVDGVTGAPVDLTGLEQGENLRRNTFTVDSTSSGSVTTYVISEILTQVNFKVPGAVTIHGMTAVAGKTIEFSCDQAFGGTVTFVQDSASAAATNQRVRGPGGVDFTLARGETCIATYFDSRWRIVGVGKAVRRRFPGEPIYDVMDEPFNAVGDGVADDTAAINAAIAAANLVPGAVYLGDRHRITAALTAIANNDIALIGRGKFNGGTIVSLDVGSTLPDPVISVTGQYAIIRGFWLVTTFASQTSRAILLSAYQPTIQDVTVSGFGVGVEVDRSNTARLINVQVGDVLGDYGFHVHGVSPDFCHNTQFEQCGVGQSYPLNLGAGRGDWAAGTAYALGEVVRANGGLWQCSTAGTSGGSAPSGLPSTNPSLVHVTPVVDGSAQWRFAMGAFAGFGHGSFAHTVMYDRCGVLQGNVGMHVFDDQGDAATFIHAWQFSSDHTFERGILIEACDGAVWLDQTLATSALSSTGVGIELGADAHGWQFSGGSVFGTAREGIIVSGSGGKLHNLEVVATSIAAANTYDAIRVDAGVTDFVIEGCTAGDVPGSGSIARYGISVGAGADRYAITDNILVGNNTGPILNTPGQSSTRVVRNNIPKWADHVASDGIEFFDLAPGTHTLTLLATTNEVVINPTSAGTVSLTQITHGAGNAGVDLIVRKEGNDGIVALVDNNTSANSIWTPAGALGDTYILSTYGDAAHLRHMTDRSGSARWRVAEVPRTTVRVNSTGTVYTRRRHNFIPGTGISITPADDGANDEVDLTIASTSGLTDGDKGDITVSGATWTIDNDVVTFAKLQNIGFGVVGNPNFGTTADPVMIAPTGGFQVLYDNNAGALTFALLVAGNYSNGSVTDAKLVDMAQSRIKGRAEGAGTGDPTDLTPTQVVAIIDGESPTWTGAHSFTGSTHTVTASADVRIETSAGGVGISAGHTVTNPANDDIILNAVGGIAINANLTTPVTNPTVGTIEITAQVDATLASDTGGVAVNAGLDASPNNGDVILNASSGIAINAHATVPVLGAATGAIELTATNIGLTSTNVTVTTTNNVTIGAGADLTLAAGTQVQTTSPFRVGNTVALDSVLTTATTGANNLAIGTVNVVRFTGPPNPLTGMVPTFDGQVVFMVNAHASADLGVFNESVSSTAANRFAGPGTSRTIRPGEMALAWYDGASDRWRYLCRDDGDL